MYGKAVPRSIEQALKSSTREQRAVIISHRDVCRNTWQRKKNAYIFEDSRTIKQSAEPCTICASLSNIEMWKDCIGILGVDDSTETPIKTIAPQENAMTK